MTAPPAAASPPAAPQPTPPAAQAPVADAPASSISVGAVSKPPPRFATTGIVAAASPSLTAPPEPAAAPAPPASSAPVPEPVAYEPPVAPVQPVAPVEPVAYEQPVQPVAYEPPVAPVEPIAYEQPAPPVQPAAYEPPVQPVAYEQPVQPAAYEQPVQPVAYEQPVQPVAYEQPVQPVAYEQPVQPVAYEPPVAPVEPVAYEQPAPPVHPAAYEQPVQPVAYEQPVQPVAYEPPVEPVAYSPPAEPVAYEPPAPPAAPMTSGYDDWHMAQPMVFDAVAAHPELYGEAPDEELVDDELDLEDDDEPAIDDRPVVGGSALLATVLTNVPRAADVKRVGRDRGATIRVVVSAVLALIVTFFILPPLLRALQGLPVIGPAVDQLESITLYPGVYGVSYWIGVLGLISVSGVVVAQMEQTAHKQGLRWDEERRLSISLAGLLAMTLVSGAFTAFGNHGWAAAVASTGFFLALCLIVPLWRSPGARVMAAQSERAWVVLLLFGIGSVVLLPTFPGLLIIVLAFTRVRTHWAQVRDGQEESEIPGPLESGSRRATMALLCAALLASSLGAVAMTEPVSSLRATDGINPTAFPGAEEGPTIPAPTG